MRSIQNHHPGETTSWPARARRGASILGGLSCAAFLTVILGSTLVRADVVVLRNGSVVEGRIALETDDLIVMEIGRTGRMHIARRKVAKVVRDEQTTAAVDEARPRGDLLLLKNGASVEGRILLESPRSITLEVGGVGTVQFDRGSVAKVVRRRRADSGWEDAPRSGGLPGGRATAADSDEGPAAPDTVTPDSQRRNDGAMGTEQPASPGDQPAASSSGRVQRFELPETIFGELPTLEALTRLLGDATEVPELPTDSLSTSLSDEYLRSALQAAREAHEAHGRLLSALEKLEARQRGRPAAPEISKPKAGAQKLSTLHEMLLQAAKRPEAEALLRALREEGPVRSDARFESRRRRD